MYVQVKMKQVAFNNKSSLKCILVFIRNQNRVCRRERVQTGQVGYAVIGLQSVLCAYFLD